MRILSRELMGQNIREARRAANLTQEGLAKVLGVQQSSICNWEKGVSSPDFGRWNEIAAALGASTTDLFFEDSGEAA